MNEIAIFQRAGSITFDDAGLKTFLKATLDSYRNVVYTEDTKADAKKALAELRKGRKELLDRVKAEKIEYMKPFDSFYSKICECTDMFDEVICAIDEQVTAFDESRKKEKDARIKEIFGEMVFEPDILAFLPLNKVYNEKWKNATYSEKQIKDDIMLAKMNVKSGLTSIKAFNSDVEDKALDVFKQTLNLPDALKVITDYESNKHLFKAKIESETRAEVIDSFIPDDNGEETKGYTYTIFLTRDSKQKLESFMDSVGIEYFERS